mmetsp:Transcript_930/g.1503  ORF Transcript_930/g.1503 Transcript_930/m.1503 type:complete len:106 (-) Transcript_930:816-1133(-)
MAHFNISMTRPSKSRSDDPDDFGLKRTSSILRNGNGRAARPPQSRSVPSRPAATSTRDLLQADHGSLFPESVLNQETQARAKHRKEVAHVLDLLNQRHVMKGHHR